MEIIDEYKFKEGTEENKNAWAHAQKFVGRGTIFLGEASLRQNSVSSTRHLITRATYFQPAKMHHLTNDSSVMSHHFAKKRHFVKKTSLRQKTCFFLG